MALLSQVHADRVEMQNGDRYVGTIVSLDTNTVVIRNDVLGTVVLPRAKTTAISIESVSPTNATVVTVAARPAPSSATNPVIDLSASLRQLGADTNFIQQIQSQFLAGAGPEANQKFNQLVSGMMSGKITVNDIRAEATTAVNQLRQLQKELGGDADAELGGYLTILEGFLRETAPKTTGAATNSTTTAIKPAAPAAVQK